MRRRWVGTTGGATVSKREQRRFFVATFGNGLETCVLPPPRSFPPSASSAGSRRTSRGGVSREVVNALVQTSRRSRPVDEPEPEPKPGGRHARARDSRERSIAGGEGFFGSPRAADLARRSGRRRDRV